MSLRGPVRLIAALLALWVVSAVAPASAVEPPTGSRNFTAPGSAPDYFTNESGPFHSGANARAARLPAAPSIALPAPRPSVARPPPRRRVAASARRLGRHHRRLVAARGHYRHGETLRRVASGRRHPAHLQTARRGALHHAARAGRPLATHKAVVATAKHRPPPSKLRHITRVRG
ncbi:MAG TPA: hypothetical protein VKQ73_09775 [Stellaceae bacterium]|nr:hypothetical protein [Stellaceae bacterium]